jgi:hypothetical protein
MGMAQVSTAGGAVSLVVLDAIAGTTVAPARGEPILVLDLSAPVGAACATCTLTFADGQAGRGRPLTNVVSAGGRAYVPDTVGTDIEICPG